MWPLLAIPALFILFPKQSQAGLLKISSTAQQVFGPFLTFGPPMQSTIDAAAMNLAKDILIKREGRKNYVYVDSKGYPTVGIGHKVLPSDNLRVGDYIEDARIEQLFRQDIDKAFSAAKSQARELGKYNADMIAALTSVNFQLGTGWTKEFANTWRDLKTDNLSGAISRINTSAWKSQTPVRVADFIAALQRNYA